MNKFIMMVGLPASGKSTIAEELSIKENAIIHASDELRKELFGDENTNDKNDVLFQELHKRIKNDLSEGRNVIYDATNIDSKRRKAFLQEIKGLNVFKKCILAVKPYEECVAQNASRERSVPEYVIRKMLLNFTIPQWYEGWDDIEIIHNMKHDYNYIDLFERIDTISQDNPHHTFTIGLHCKSCSTYVCSYFIEKGIQADRNLITAALMHDIGKEFTKEFKNYKGEPTDIAHYYHHHNVSAYLSLFYLSYLSEYDLLDVVNYIQWHMQPFFIETEKAKKKFIKLVGQEFYDKLMILHEADKMAH